MKSEFFNPNSKPSYALMSTISGHVLFRNAHAYAKAGRPFTDMEWMCALDEKKGLDMGMSYRTDKKCCEFIQCIADKQQAILQASVQSETSFLSWWMVLLTHLLLRQK